MSQVNYNNEIKIRIIPEIYDAALIYKNNMVGRTFMYVFNGKYIEVTYKTDNFKHLTGIPSRLTPNEFYYQAIERTIEKEQIKDFDNRHPYDLAKKKLKHLLNLYNMSSSECFMQVDITTETETYKFGTTNLKFSILLTEDIDLYGIKKSEKYISKSLRHKDCFEKSSDVYDVTHIFVKYNNEKKYKNVTYSSNNELPECVEGKIDESVKQYYKFV